MRINTNMMALNAQNKLRVNQSGVEGAIQKLSSGLRINSAADDAAGLAISEKMRAQIRGLSQAQDNAQDGISLLQTAEGALQQTTDIIQRMRELVIKAQNTGVLTEEDKTSISEELSTLRGEVDRIATSTTFNGKKLLDGTLAVQRATSGGTLATGVVNVVNANADTTYKIIAEENNNIKICAMVDDGTGNLVEGEKIVSAVAYSTAITGKITFDSVGVTIDFRDTEISGADLHGKTIITAATATGKDKKAKADFKIGANNYTEDTLAIGIGDMRWVGLSKKVDGTNATIDISNATKANDTLTALDCAIDAVSSQRATLGAIQNRMEYAISALSATEENLTAAESRIRDVDMADEMVSYTKNNILNQSAMAMLAQANQQPQAILQLLQ